MHKLRESRFSDTCLIRISLVNNIENTADGKGKDAEKKGNLSEYLQQERGVV